MSTRQKTIKTFFIGLLILIGIYNPCAIMASILNVPADYPTITKALRAAKKGDIILLETGIYNIASGEEFPLVLSEEITIQGKDQRKTIIDGDKSHRLISCLSINNASISNLTLKNGASANNGGAIDAKDSHLQIKECFFETNTAKRNGGAIYMINCTGIVSKCYFIQNKASNGGGIYISGKQQIEIIDCLFKNNNATRTGSAIFGNGLLLISDCKIIENNRYVFWLQGESTIKNCIFRANPYFCVVGNQNNKIKVLNCSFIANGKICVVFVPLIKDSTFIGNRSCITNEFKEKSAPVTIDSCTFVHNKLSKKTAVIKTTGNSVTILRNSVIAYNKGIGISKDKTSPANQISNNIFYENSKGNFGSGINEQTNTNGNTSIKPPFINPAKSIGWVLQDSTKDTLFIKSSQIWKLNDAIEINGDKALHTIISIEGNKIAFAPPLSVACQPGSFVQNVGLRSAQLPDYRLNTTLEKLRSQMHLNITEVGPHTLFARVNLAFSKERNQVKKVKIEIYRSSDNKIICSDFLDYFTSYFKDTVLDVPNIIKGGSYYGIATFYDNSNNIIKTIKTKDLIFSSWNFDWIDNQLGITDKVIKPWTPLRYKQKNKHQIISCWGRDYEFANSLLPKQIHATQPEPTRGEIRKKLLAKQIDIDIVSNNKKLKWTNTVFKKTKQTGTEIDVEGELSNEYLTIKLKSKMEFDGFYKIHIKMIPKTTVPIDYCRLAIPLRTPIARLFHSVGRKIRVDSRALSFNENQKGRLWDSTAINQVFLPYVWIGDEDRGIAWMADNDRSLILSPKKPFIEIYRDDQATYLYVYFINTPTQLTKPIATTFSLQATPVKPRLKGGMWRKWYRQYCVLWPFSNGRKNNWADILPNDWNKATQWAKKRSSVGVRPFIYVNMPLVGKDTRAYKSFQKEWTGSGWSATSVRSMLDYVMTCFKEWVEKADIEGVYFDDTFPVANTNIFNGAAYLGYDGRIKQGFTVFGQREYIKRTATFFQQYGKQRPVIEVHVTDASCISCFSFADIFLNGEMKGYPPTGTKNGDFVTRWGNDKGLSHIRATALGRQYGMIPTFHCTPREERFSRPEEIWAVLGIHDILPFRGEAKEQWLGTKPNIKFDMDSKELGFIPYWEKKKRVGVISSEHVLASAWQLSNKLKIQISNLSDTNTQAGIKLKLNELNLPENFEVRDQVDGHKIKHNKGLIEKIAIPRHKYKSLILAAPEAYQKSNKLKKIPTPKKKIDDLCDSFNTIDDNWQFEASKNCKAARAEIFYNHLRIAHDDTHYSYIKRDFNLDNVSVQSKILPLKRDARKNSLYPGIILHWNNGSFIKALTYFRGAGKLMAFYALDGSKKIFKEKWLPNPKNTVDFVWLKINLLPKTIEISGSANGLEWQKTLSLKRTDNFSGPANSLLLGSATRDKDTVNTELNNDLSSKKTAANAFTLFDDLIVGRNNIKSD